MFFKFDSRIFSLLICVESYIIPMNEPSDACILKAAESNRQPYWLQKAMHSKENATCTVLEFYNNSNN